MPDNEKVLTNSEALSRLRELLRQAGSVHQDPADPDIDDEDRNTQVIP